MTLGDGAVLPQGGFTYIIRFGISDAALVTGARSFIGLSSVTTLLPNTEASARTNVIGIGELGSDKTQWHFVYGGSAAQSSVALGADLGTPNNVAVAYELCLFSPSTSNSVVGYEVTNLLTGNSVNGVVNASASVGVVLPHPNTLLTHHIWRCNSNTALAVGIDVLSVYTEQDL
jgi:hypothetical protein